MIEKELTYLEGEIVFRCFFYSEEGDKRPGVLMAPAFEGCNEAAKDNARRLAHMGYAAMLVDLYGEGVVHTEKEAALAGFMSLFEDRKMLMRRMNSAYEVLAAQDNVDSNCIGAVGTCMGGMAVLDLARSGADVKGVVSFHGVLAAPDGYKAENMTSKVLAMHGDKDAQIPAEQIEAFKQEMTEAGVDWQFHIFGNAMHAFTDPEAGKIGGEAMSRKYDPVATERAWRAAHNFFDEIFESSSLG